MSSGGGDFKTRNVQDDEAWGDRQWHTVGGGLRTGDSGPRECVRKSVCMSVSERERERVSV